MHAIMQTQLIQLIVNFHIKIRMRDRKCDIGDRFLWHGCMGSWETAVCVAFPFTTLSRVYTEWRPVSISSVVFF